MSYLATAAFEFSPANFLGIFNVLCFQSVKCKIVNSQYRKLQLQKILILFKTFQTCLRIAMSNSPDYTF